MTATEYAMSQIRETMEEENVNPTEMAVRLETSRQNVMRMLEARSVTVASLERMARAIGMVVEIQVKRL